ncbi:unnamed protein product [Linum trigynum]|uniref:Uncharacterized protein n=1 Tax=Linum trigynum TaxID=586398 RepID=A0AAV2FWL9_9ROSI
MKLRLIKSDIEEEQNTVIIHQGSRINLFCREKDSQNLHPHIGFGRTLPDLIQTPASEVYSVVDRRNFFSQTPPDLIQEPAVVVCLVEPPYILQLNAAGGELWSAGVLFSIGN